MTAFWEASDAEAGLTFLGGDKTAHPITVCSGLGTAHLPVLGRSLALLCREVIWGKVRSKLRF